MAEKKTFIEKIQARLKGVDGMVPYMFPMIGKNYEKSERKILVVCGYVLQDDFVKEKFKTIDNVFRNAPIPDFRSKERHAEFFPKSDKWKKTIWENPNCFKDDVISYAWENMPIDGNPNGIRTPQSILKGECNVDDIIFTSYSRFPNKEKFRHGENALEIQSPNCPFGGLVGGDEIAKNFLIDLIECTKPDEVWVLGQYTENLMLEIPKYPGKINVEKYKREKRQEYPNYRLILLRNLKKNSLNIVKDVSNKLEKKFDTFVQGKEFAKLSKEQQKACLSSFADYIKDAIKQLE